MRKHTLYYQIGMMRSAGYIAMADDFLQIIREYRAMKKALRQIKEACKVCSILSVASIGSELEKKVRL